MTTKPASDLPALPEPAGLFITTDDGRWVEAPSGCDPARCTKLYFPRAIQEAAFNAGRAEAGKDAWQLLTDEDRQRAFNSLPDMLDGFLKKWGWLHFAHAIEAECRAKNESAAMSAKDPS